MINSKKKGFTIVELVIVIAVIAVLAAVLIPTFSNLVKKANMSADQQAVRQMNTALAIETRAEDIEGAVALLDKAGYNAFESLSPVSKGYNFYWVASNNTIVLVDENLKVVFPANLEGEDLSDDIAKGEAHNLKKGFADATPENSDDFRDAVEKGQSVILSSTMDLGTERISVKAGEDVVLELKDNATVKIGYQDPNNQKHHYAVENRGTLTIKGNGTVESRGLSNYGTIIIEEGITIKSIDDDGGAAIWNYAGAEVVIKGGTFEATTGNHADTNEGNALKYEPGVINNSGKITINGGTFRALNTGCYAVNNYGELVINGGTFEAWRGVIATTNATVTINGGTFVKTSTDNSGQVFYVDGTGAIKIASATVKLGNDTYEFASIPWNGNIFASGTKTTEGSTVILKK